MEGDEQERLSSVEALLEDSRLYQERFPGVLRKYAYRFDGAGNYAEKEFDLTAEKGGDPESTAGEFSWYHVELPKADHKLSKSAEYLIDALCPPLKLHEILSLVSNGPYCGQVDQALVFRVNSPGPAASDYTLRLAVRVTARSVVSVSLGRVPRLGFSRSRASLLKEVPRVGGGAAGGAAGGTVIEEPLLEFLLRMDHSEEADNPVPLTVSSLLIHVIDAYVDQVHDTVTSLEMELDAVEHELDKGGFTAKRQMIEDRRFPLMHLNLQRILQVVAHGEQVFPRVKEKLASKSWFAQEGIVSLEELIGRLRRLKENVGFIANRVNAIQAGLDSWQAEQINRKLYYLSFLSMIFLPLSIVTGVFGMNVGGVPWTAQKTSEMGNGFENVMVICAVILLFLVACFVFPVLYSRFSTWRQRRARRRRFSLGRKSFLRRSAAVSPAAGRGYVRL
ncbi:magnesium transporter CorA-like family protein [Wolffia australiana]